MYKVIIFWVFVFFVSNFIREDVFESIEGVIKSFVIDIFVKIFNENVFDIRFVKRRIVLRLYDLIRLFFDWIEIYGI